MAPKSQSNRKKTPDKNAHPQAAPTSPWTDALHKAWEVTPDGEQTPGEPAAPDATSDALTDTYNG